MILLSKYELKTLIDNSKKPCVSIYMPAEVAGPSTRQNPIRFKNLIGEAEENLLATDLSTTEVENFLEPAKALIDDYDFWQHQSDGLALFITSEVFRYYRLPHSFEELVVVSDRFHLKPLLPLITGDGKFYLLALSQNELRLFEATRYSIRQLELPNDVPQSLAEALKYDDPEKQLQYHSGTSGQGGGNTPVYHGQGVGTTDNKNEIKRYFQKVDKGLQALMQNEVAPLVLAGVEYLLPIYHEANSYAHIFEEGVTGNPENLQPEELHQQALEIVMPHFQQGQEVAVNSYKELIATDQASSKLEKIVSAAYYGQVDTLFVTLGLQEWGTFDPQASKIEISSSARPDDVDLLDFAAVHTVLQGGTVYAVELELLPDASPIAAVFRYPIVDGQTSNISKAATA